MRREEMRYPERSAWTSARRANFAFETTLAGRTPATWIQSRLRGGYKFGLMFLLAFLRQLPANGTSTDRLGARLGSCLGARCQDVEARQGKMGAMRLKRL